MMIELAANTNLAHTGNTCSNDASKCVLFSKSSDGYFVVVSSGHPPSIIPAGVYIVDTGPEVLIT